MAVGFASYGIARSGLMVSESALNVTGHNIANVNTTGYTRQQAMITSSMYHDEVKYQIGTGADIQQIRQIRHGFLDNIYRNESQNLGYWDAKQKTFEDIQAILGEPMEKGFQDAVNQFWDSWQELSKSPDSLTVRAVVRQRGDTFTQYVNHLGDQIDKLQNDLNSEVSVRINEVNSYTKQINDLNLKILSAENYGDNANDYRDQRNVLLDKLSKLVDIDAYETQDGQINISTGGYFLVSKGSTNELYADEPQPGAIYNTVKIKGANVAIQLKSGTIKGLLESRGEVVGAKGSEQNGSPYDKIDLVFAIDTSTPTADLTGANGITAYIDNIVKQYKDKGIDVRLGMTTFDTTVAGTTAPTFYADANAFKAALGGIAFDNTPGDRMSLDALQATAGLNFRTDALKQVVLLTGAIADTTSAKSIVNITKTLKDNDIFVDIIGSTGPVQTQLASVASDTGGNFIDNAAGMATNITSVSNDMHDEIYANIHDTTNIIPDLKNRMNLLINVIAREINSVHKTGYTLDGNLGQDFFVPIDPNYPMEMGNIQLNPALSNLNNIVASSSMEKGDNTIATQIADMRNAPLIGKLSGMTSFDDFYRTTILNLGDKGSEASRVSDDQSKLTESADNSRKSITDVSMDEEMSNMMKYQYAYEASSKVMNVIDDMISTIINKMGIR